MTSGPDPIRRFAEETWPDERALARYNAQLGDIAARAEGRRRLPLWLPVGALAAGAAALWLLALPEPAPKPLALQIDRAAAETQLTEHVQVLSEGVASVSGTEAAPVIDLSSGSVTVSVDPGLGIDLRVRTAEGEVRVLGTVFTVERSALGTEVSVERGKVSVSCADGSAHPALLPEAAATCLPTTPEGLLGRARALQEAGASGAADAIAAGLATAGGATRAELLAMRLDLALGAGEHAAALADAKAYLESGEKARREHALRVAARLSAAESCERARPYLDELMALGDANPEPELSARCAAR